MKGGRAHPLSDWHAETLEALASAASSRQYILADETGSTQDLARHLEASAETVVVAGAQRDGRGRFARRWNSTANEGIYITLVLPWREPQYTSARVAVGTACALARALSGRAEVGIKWPNDILARPLVSPTDAPPGGWKKISGILLEQAGERALAGVGVNIGQRSWPDELHNRAISLCQLGVETTSAKMIAALLRAIDEARAQSDEEVAERFASLDVVTGRRCDAHSAGGMMTGVVEAIDLKRGLFFRSDGERVPRWLDAEVTSLKGLLDA